MECARFAGLPEDILPEYASHCRKEKQDKHVRWLSLGTFYLCSPHHMQSSTALLLMECIVVTSYGDVIDTKLEELRIMIDSMAISNLQGTAT